MRSIAPFVFALCLGLLGLAGCRGDGLTTAVAPEPSLAAAPPACSLSGAATTVRYQTRRAAHHEQAIQQVNGFAGEAAGSDCRGALPMASVVTLRYRIVGS